MTKNEAIEKAKDLECSCFYMNDFDNVIMKEDFIDLITQIYNDFESNICENCKYFNKNEYECKNKKNYQYSYSEQGENITSYMNVDKKFGCNKFKRM